MSSIIDTLYERRSQPLWRLGSNFQPPTLHSLRSELFLKQGEPLAITENVSEVIEILREKFESVAAFGPQQLVEFDNSSNPEEQAMQARRGL